MQEHDKKQSKELQTLERRQKEERSALEKRLKEEEKKLKEERIHVEKLAVAVEKEQAKLSSKRKVLDTVKKEVTAVTSLLRSAKKRKKRADDRATEEEEVEGYSGGGPSIDPEAVAEAVERNLRVKLFAELSSSTTKAAATAVTETTKTLMNKVYTKDLSNSLKKIPGLVEKLSARDGQKWGKAEESELKIFLRKELGDVYKNRLTKTQEQLQLEMDLKKLATDNRVVGKEMCRTRKALGNFEDIKTGLSENVGALHEVVFQMKARLDSTEKARLDQTIATLESKVLIKLVEAKHSQDMNNQQMQLKWAKHAQGQAEMRNGETVKDLDRLYKTIASSFSSISDNRIKSNPYGVALAPVPAQPNNHIVFGASCHQQQPLSGERPDSVSNRGPKQPDQKRHVQADWKTWGPREMLDWLIEGGCQPLAAVLFPAEPNVQPPVVLKHGYQLAYLTPEVLEQIGGNDVGLHFAKTSFMDLLEKLKNISQE